MNQLRRELGKEEKGARSFKDGDHAGSRVSNGAKCFDGTRRCVHDESKVTCELLLFCRKFPRRKRVYLTQLGIA